MNAHVRLCLCVCAGLLLVAPGCTKWEPLPAARNVIVLIPDGCSQSMVTLARWMRAQPLALDRVQAGAVKTFSANSLVTDSAAAATALACGFKTANGVLGAAAPQDAALLPPNPPYASYQPLATVLEAARHAGRSTGLVVTDEIFGATPAGFAAHAASRKADDDIAEQLVYQDLDVVFGGGRRKLLPAAAGGERADGEDLLAALRTRGAQVVADRAGMLSVTTGRVWGIFAPGKLAPEIDRSALAPNQPTLAEMTAKAIALLRQNRNGFFLMVEGSQVDDADHANDASRAVRDFLAFDDAVAVALAYANAEGRGRTLVIACPDHDTGGMTIGQRGHTPRTVADLTAPLDAMPVSAEVLAGHIGTNRTAANVMAYAQAWWDIRLTVAEADAVTNRVAGGLSLDRALDETIARTHTAIGWTSFDHTGVDVPLWSLGPGRPLGLVDNTAIALAAARAMGADLPALTRALFVDAQQAFPDARLDTSDPTHPALVIGKARLPLNKNLLLLNGREIRLDGLVVHLAPTGRTYLPQQAVDLIRAAR